MGNCKCREGRREEPETLLQQVREGEASDGAGPIVARDAGVKEMTGRRVQRCTLEAIKLPGCLGRVGMFTSLGMRGQQLLEFKDETVGKDRIVRGMPLGRPEASRLRQERAEACYAE